VSFYSPISKSKLKDRQYIGQKKKDKKGTKFNKTLHRKQKLKHEKMCIIHRENRTSMLMSTLEVTHATGHLPYPEQTQTVSQQMTAQFHQQDDAELNSTSETEPQSSAVFF
jgi:hypothetical protein